MLIMLFISISWIFSEVTLNDIW